MIKGSIQTLFFNHFLIELLFNLLIKFCL